MASIPLKKEDASSYKGNPNHIPKIQTFADLRKHVAKKAPFQRSLVEMYRHGR